MTDPLFEDFTKEIDLLVKEEVLLHLSLTPVDAMALIGALQLALRHPGYKGAIRVHVINIIEHLRLNFAMFYMPAIAEVIRRGEDPNFDVSEKKPS